MKFRILLFFTAFISSYSIFAQVERQTCITNSRNPWEWPSNTNWFVGDYSGSNRNPGYLISFDGGFSDKKIGGGDPFRDFGMGVYEAVASFSNDDGKLIAFSNGRWGWDKSGGIVTKDVLVGNEGANLVASSSQGFISVRHPLKPFDYYFVTVGDLLGGYGP